MTLLPRNFIYRQPQLFLAVLMLPPLLWLGIIYLGSLFSLLAHAFYSIDEFSGIIIYEASLSTFKALFTAANIDVLLRSVVMAFAVTLASALIAYPFCYYAARYAKGSWKAAFYFLVMLPLWSSYLVKLYAWKLILAKEGIISWAAAQLSLSAMLENLLASPLIDAPSLSMSSFGTFIVFIYIWLPFMILPTQAALERVPNNLIEASADLGAKPHQTFHTIIWPLALPGLIAGSIFTFSLTLGDYIIPSVIGNSTYYLGQTVYTLQGTAGNIPLAAAFSIAPIVVMLIYLGAAKKMGAFNAL